MKSVAAFVAALALTVPAPHARADPAPPVVYAALGDSFSAGAGLSPPLALADCLRSEVNYPHLVAKALRATEFRDVTCSGATTADLTGHQLPYLPAQFDALTPDTTLVTVGIGANDVGLVRLAVACLNVAPPPFGRSCAAANTANGGTVAEANSDTVAEAIDGLAPTFRAIVGEIRQRSPRARIVFVGYPTAIRPGGCPGTQPIWPADADYLQSLITRLDTVTARETTATGAEFVDLEPSTRGHDTCAAPADRWIEGAIPVSIAAPIPLHPNAAGHANAAARVLDALAR